MAVRSLKVKMLDRPGPISIAAWTLIFQKWYRSEEHTSELQSRENLVCRLLLESHDHHRVIYSFPTRRSSDLGGANWQVILTDFNAELNDIYFLNDTIGYAVGNGGTIIKSEDAGQTWSYINSGMDTDFSKVVFHPDNPLIGLLAGKNGTILRTEICSAACTEMV